MAFANEQEVVVKKNVTVTEGSALFNVELINDNKSLVALAYNIHTNTIQMRDATKLFHITVPSSQGAFDLVTSYFWKKIYRALGHFISILDDLNNYSYGLLSVVNPETYFSKFDSSFSVFQNGLDRFKSAVLPQVLLQPNHVMVNQSISWRSHPDFYCGVVGLATGFIAQHVMNSWIVKPGKEDFQQIKKVHERIRDGEFFDEYGDPLQGSDSHQTWKNQIDLWNTQSEIYKSSLRLTTTSKDSSVKAEARSLLVGLEHQFAEEESWHKAMLPYYEGGKVLAAIGCVVVGYIACREVVDKMMKSTQHIESLPENRTGKKAGGVNTK